MSEAQSLDQWDIDTADSLAVAWEATGVGYRNASRLWAKKSFGERGREEGQGGGL